MLIVEDNEYMLDILANSLRQIGFTRVSRRRATAGKPWSISS